MSRTAQFSTWLTIVFLVVVAMHTYFWWRLVHGTDVSRSWRLMLTAALIILGLFFPAPFFANRYLEPPWREAVLWIGFVWMGLAFFLFIGLLATDVLRLVVRIPPRILAAGACAFSLIAGAYASWNAFRGPLVRRVRIALPRLPESLSGTTIAQISDLHVGGILRRGFAEDVVRTVNDLHPDLIAITGDLVDGSAARDGHMIDPIADLRAKYGVFFIPGNHEYYAGAEAWFSRIRKLGVRVLRNERVRIGDDAGGFDLAGVDDPAARTMGGKGPDIPGALKGRDPNVPVVLLAHNPMLVIRAAKHGVDLQLSGHTHGGQIWPFNYLVRLSHPHLAGLSREGGTQVYVNVGTGFWGPPMRLGTRSEITLFELVSPAP